MVCFPFLAGSMISGVDELAGSTEDGTPDTNSSLIPGKKVMQYLFLSERRP